MHMFMDPNRKTQPYSHTDSKVCYYFRGKQRKPRTVNMRKSSETSDCSQASVINNAVYDLEVDVATETI